MKHYAPSVKVKGQLCKIDQLFISELGFLMVKVYNDKKKVWINYNLGEWDKVLPIEKIINDESKRRNKDSN